MRKRQVIVFLLAVFLAGSFIGNASARGGIFVIEPVQEITENVALGVSDSVFGNISVEGGVIDFYVTKPNGSIIFWHNDTAYTDFNFTASEDGNYTMHFINSLSFSNITLTLNYSVHFVVVIQQKLVFNFSTGVAHVFASSPFPVKRLNPKLEDLDRVYINVRESQKILNIMKEIWKDMPLRSIVETLLLAFLGFSLLHIRFPKSVTIRLDLTFQCMNHYKYQNVRNMEKL